MDNSFPNVTRRKLHRSSNSLDDTFIEDNESPAISGNYASLPDIGNQYSFDMTELLEYKTKINELHIELMSAHKEIENLNRENILLKDELEDTKRTLNKFKTILQSDNIYTPKVSSTIKKKKKTNTSSICLSGSDMQNTNEDTNKYKIEELKCKKILKNEGNGQITHATKPNKVLSDKSITEGQRIPFRKILFLGDQQAVDLSIILHNLRTSAKNYRLPAQYKISGTVYSNATTEYITQNVKTINEELNDHDWVILSVGSNDQNPTKFYIDLSYALKSLTKPNILIISVLENPYLNETKLNNMVKTIVKNFKNCHYLDLFVQPNLSIISKFNISSTINMYINNYDYKCYYIDNCFKKLNTNGHTRQNYKHTKGTIPYYFGIQQKKNDAPIAVSRGTIPYYFKNINESFFRKRLKQ